MVMRGEEMRVAVRRWVLVVAVMASAQAAASPITFTFVGDIFGTPTGIFAGESLVSGFYTFDSELIARSAVSDPPTEINVFETFGPVNDFIDNWFISVTIGSVTTTSAGNAHGTHQFPRSNHVLEFNDSPIRDAFAYDLRSQTAGDKSPPIDLEHTAAQAADADAAG